MKVFILFVTLVMSSHARQSKTKKPKHSQDYTLCCEGKHGTRSHNYAWAKANKKNNCPGGWTSSNVTQGAKSSCAYNNPQKYVS
jgi:hypothetical protein